MGRLQKRRMEGLTELTKSIPCSTAKVPSRADALGQSPWLLGQWPCPLAGFQRSRIGGVALQCTGHDALQDAGEAEHVEHHVVGPVGLTDCTGVAPAGAC